MVVDVFHEELPVLKKLLGADESTWYFDLLFDVCHPSILLEEQLELPSEEIIRRMKVLSKSQTAFLKVLYIGFPRASNLIIIFSDRHICQQNWRWPKNL
jgi:hypothetical protein